MDIKAIREKMNNYFDNVSPEKIVKEFVQRGYVLETCPPDKSYFTTYAHPLGHNGLFSTPLPKKQGKTLAFFI
ncbi:hypothetical protein J3L18_28300 [Mucilaginibacter gossypii]|uniref:hypothetical protein n=1 Tax=Mucilaginibacter gossypii TaxID=551996 RepID=UPI000DCC1B31|nr:MULTISPECIES: hypothetical protein [Mucilaginibacter]QTE36969.1 hypothetical protein J3L18_28300 [Mucilaginibacter gossypii]RAV45767.1 hypothetical protein DIU36_30770 [Mucilaginibacter rubeus]